MKKETTLLLFIAAFSMAQLLHAMDRNDDPFTRAQNLISASSDEVPCWELTGFIPNFSFEDGLNNWTVTDLQMIEVLMGIIRHG